MSNLLPSTAASDIISYVRGRCRLGSAPPNAVFQTPQMLIALNDINEWFYYWPLDNGGLAPWKFTRATRLYQPKNLTTLAADIAAGATNLTLADGTDFDSPSADAAAAYFRTSDGALAFFTYEGRAVNALSGVNPIDIPFTSGTEIRKCYTLPQDYGRPIRCMVNRREYKFTDTQFDDIPYAGYFSTKYLTSTSGYDNFYLILPLLIGTGITVTMHYVRRPTIISAETTKIDAKDGTARWAVIKKFEEFVWNHRGELDLAREAGQEADRLIRMYSSSQSSEDASSDQGPTFDLD